MTDSSYVQARLADLLAMEEEVDALIRIIDDKIKTISIETFALSTTSEHSRKAREHLTKARIVIDSGTDHLSQFRQEVTEWGTEL